MKITKKEDIRPGHYFTYIPSSWSGNSTRRVYQITKVIMTINIIEYDYMFEYRDIADPLSNDECDDIFHQTDDEVYETLDEVKENYPEFFI